MILYNDDCIDRMKQMIEDGVQVDSIVTDPPYELGFMGRQWDSTGIAFSKETWELALKLLKPGGHLLAFSGSRTYHRMAVAIEDAGFEIRDQIMWLYGSGFPKSLNIGKAIDKKLGNERVVVGQNQDILTKQAKDLKEGKRKILDSLDSGAPDRNNGFVNVSADITKGNSEWEGWGTALKPAHEPLVMARKPLSEKTVTSNVLKHGTGGINIDGCRIEGNDAKYPDTMQDFKDQGKKSKEAIGIDKLGFGQTENVARKKAVRKSRSVGGVWTNENSGMKQEANHYADADPRGRFPANVMHDGSDAVKDVFPTSKSRYFYSAKVSKKERNQGAGVKNIHPTVKPVELMKYLCRLVTPKGGTVLDPFMGSGSTGMAAKYEEFDFIGIEREKEYFEIATSRIDSVEVSSTLESFFN